MTRPEVTGHRKMSFPVAGRYTQDIAQSADGLLWIHGKGSQDSLAIYHEMDPPGHSIHDYICAHFRPGLVFVDVGAHVGHYTLRAAKAGCTVYAVEANPESAAQLRLNLLANKVEGVTLWSVAAWSDFTVLEFNRDAGYPAFRDGGSSLMPAPDDAERAGMGIWVAGVPLDRLLYDVKALDLVKIDTEGADLHVVTGMLQAIKRLRPKLIIENHSIYGYYTPKKLANCERMLSDLAGYSWKSAEDEGVEGLINYRIGFPP